MSQLQKEARIRMLAKDLFYKAQEMGITLDELKFSHSTVKDGDNETVLLDGVTYKDIND